MKRDKSLFNSFQKAFQLNLFVFLIIVLLIWLSLDFFYSYKSNLKIIENNIISEKKLYLKQVVRNIINYIDYNRKNIKQLLLTQIKEDTNNISKIIELTYNNLKNFTPEDRLKITFRTILRSIKHEDGAMYFFAFDTNGVEQANGDRPELEGKNILNIKDNKGNYVVKDMLKIIKEKGEGFYEYYWTKPKSKSSKLGYKKISYIKLFKPLNWVIGTGVYYDFIENLVKEKVKKYINRYRFGKNGKGYIFVIKLEKKGNSIRTFRLVNPNNPEKLMGKEIPLNLKDVKGNLFHREIVEKCLKNGEGFVTYYFKKFKNNKISKKISYVKYYPKWNWIVGAGVYLDDIDTIIAKQKDLLIQKLIIKFVTAFIIIFLFYLFTSLKFKKLNINLESEFKNTFSKLPEKIDLKNIKIKEFHNIAEKFNNLLEKIEEKDIIIKGFYNNATIANYVIDSKGYFIDANKTSEKITGYTIEELRNMKYFELLHPEDREIAFKRVEKRFKGEMPLKAFEYKIITKSGEQKWVLVAQDVIYLKSIDEKIIIGSGIEITEQKRLQQQINEQYNLIKALIDSVDTPIWVFDINGYIFKIVNKKFYEFFGIKKNVIGKSIQDFFPENICKKAFETNEYILKNKQKITYEIKLKLSDYKDEKILLITKSPIFDTNGEISGIVGIAVDITDKIKTEKELSRIKNLESLGILAGGIAHDFNNILTAISGNIELLQLYIKDEKSTKIFERLLHATSRAKDLSKKLLTFSKGDYLIKESTDISELVKDVAEFVLSGSSINVNYEIEQNIPEILIDKAQISEVLHNIILNSKQSLEKKGSYNLNISLKKIMIKENEIIGLKQGNYIEIAIKDTGEGIPEDAIDKIFHPFFTTKEKGSGLGLTISYSIIKKHGGTINVKSQHGVGSEFKIYLPIIEAKNININKENNEEKNKKSLNKLKILIMEDESDVREVFKEIFEMLNHKVDFATKGEEAIKLYSSNSYDLVILDMTIKGGMGGVETIKRLKEINPEIYAIVTTGYANSDVVQNYKKYGFKDVLLKPFNISKLKDIINKLL